VPWLLFFLDEGNIAAPLEAGEGDRRDIFGLGIEAQVFFEVVVGNERASHLGSIDLAVADERDRLALDQLAERVRFAGSESARAMDN
jgi:hypothetical protein